MGKIINQDLMFIKFDRKKKIFVPCGVLNDSEFEGEEDLLDKYYIRFGLKANPYKKAEEYNDMLKK